MIVVKGGEKTCPPAFTRRKDIGRMTLRSGLGETTQLVCDEAIQKSERAF